MKARKNESIKSFNLIYISLSSWYVENSLNYIKCRQSKGRCHSCDIDDFCDPELDYAMSSTINVSNNCIIKNDN